jgi:predicted nucleic acid-binding protein
VRDVVIDTDVAPLLQKHQAPAWVLRQLAGARIWLTFVTVGELAKWTVVRWWGEYRRNRLDAWTARRPVMPHDTQIARLRGELAGQAPAAGTAPAAERHLDRRLLPAPPGAVDDADPGLASCPAHDPRGAVPVQPAAVSSQEDRPVTAFADRQVDRPRDARRERDGPDLAPFAGNGQRPVPAFQAQSLDVGADCLRPTGVEPFADHSLHHPDASTLDTGIAIHQDLGWIYRPLLPESQKIAGLACFYSEKVDPCIEGVHHQLPQTKFSHRGPGTQSN